MLILLFRKGDFSYPKPSRYNAFYSVLFAVLYSGMNVLPAIPLLTDMGSTARHGTLSAFLATLTVGALAGVALCAIRNAGDNVALAPMPLVVVLQSGVLFPILATVAVLTSLAADYYPVWQFFQKKKRATLSRLAVLACAVGISFFGLSNLVTYLYPITGFLGLIYTLICAFRL